MFGAQAPLPMVIGHPVTREFYAVLDPFSDDFSRDPSRSTRLVVGGITPMGPDGGARLCVRLWGV